jgi:predicted Na+-dependent transporter
VVGVQLLRRYAAPPGYVTLLALIVVAVSFYFLPRDVAWVYIGIVAALALATLLLGPGREVRG